MKNKLYDFYKATELKIVNFAHRFGSLRLRTQSLWILLFLLFVILCNLQFIAKGGDAIHKWFMVRLYLEHGTFFPIQPDHHLLRWGLMWPVIGVCKLLGASIYCYYLYPLFCYCAGGLLFFWLGRQILSRETAPFAVLLYAFYPVIIHEGTQFLPLVPATMWILMTLLFTLRFLDGKQKNPLWMVAAGAALVFAYGCKETSFFWAPGIFLFLAFSPAEKECLHWKKFHVTWGMLLFFLTCIGGMGIETLIINQIYDCTLGRYELLLGSHLLGDTQQGNYATIWSYPFSFLRQFSWHGKYYQFLPQNISILMGLTGAFFILKYHHEIRRRFLAVAFLGAYLCHCYVIFKINPISYPELVIHRYLIAVLCVGFLLFCASLPDLKKWCCAGRAWRRILVVSLGGIWLITVAIYNINARLQDGNLFQLEQMRRTIPAALKNGDAVGVVTERKKIAPDIDNRVLPDKWGLLHLRCWGDTQMFFELQKKRCTYTPYGKKQVIVWLSAPREGKRRFVLDEYSIIRDRDLPSPDFANGSK